MPLNADRLQAPSLAAPAPERRGSLEATKNEDSKLRPG